jgi:hypothetical protein
VKPPYRSSRKPRIRPPIEVLQQGMRRSGALTPASSGQGRGRAFSRTLSNLWHFQRVKAASLQILLGGKPVTAYTWIGGTGNWKTASNWSPAGPPTATDTAAISETGAAYTVTINSADVAQSLTESSSSATVDDVGSLTLSSTFTLSAGTFILGSGGALSGGATKLTGGTFTCDGGTLSSVTFDGALDLSETDASVYIASGTVVNNAAGTGAGTINDTGESSTLYFDNTQTFNNATINLGGTAGYNSFLEDYDSTGSGTVLTLGSNVTINETGDAVIGDSGNAGDGIVNQGAIKQSGASSQLTFSGNSLTNSGTITGAGSGGALTIDDTTFTNSGTLAISNGEIATIEPTNFTNAAAGVISVGAGSTLTLAPAGSWSNAGSITLASGSSLYLGGSFTLAGLGKLTNSGATVYVEGTFTNTGSLSGTNALGQAVLYGGTVQGGIVRPAGLVFSNHGGTLSGVTFDGFVSLTGSFDSVSLASGTVVNNAAGNGAGTINDIGEGSALYFDNTQTFNNVTINLGNADYYSSLYEYDSTGSGTVLTLGSNVAINESYYGYIADIADSGNAGDGIVNQGAIKQSGASSQLTFSGNSLTNSGTITGAGSGGALTIDDTTFTNSGTLAISSGETATIESTNFTNAAAGVISVGADSTLSLTLGGSWSNLGSITLASGSSLYLGGSFTIASLGKLTNSGATVYIEGTFTNTGTLSGTNVLGQAVLDGGTVQGGTAKPAGLVLSDGGGTLSGVTYDGTLDLSGDLDSVNLISGTVVNNAAGTGAGTIDDTGYASALGFDNTQTFNNVTINLGDTAGYYSFLQEYDLTDAGTVLTLGSNVTIDESGYGYIADSGNAGDGIVNQGAIKQSGTSSQLTFYGNSLTNSGTITGASSGGALAIYDTTFTNSGTLAISNGDALTIATTNFSNIGSITLASASSLYVDITFTLAELGTLTNSGGTVYIEGTLDLTGGTLNASSGLGQSVLDGGAVDGGTVTSSALALFTSSGTLSGVTYDGTLDLSEAEASVQLTSGTVVNNAAGTGAGTINDTGEGSALYFDNTQTFNNATINLGSMSEYYYYNSFLEEYDQTGAGAVLTLGSNVTIDESGYAQIADSGYTGDGIVNQGAITQSGTSSELTFYGNSLTNSGTITGASSGGTLTIAPTTFINSGTLAISNGDAVTIEATNFSNEGSITLAGGGSLYVDITFTLAELGKLTNSGGTVYIEGTLDLTGGTLNASSGLGQAVLDGGAVDGGTVASSALGFSYYGGTLSGVTYDGALNLSGTGANVDLASGTVVNNAAGTGAGTINDSGEGSALYFDNTQTFNNATINLGSTLGYYSYLQDYDFTGAGTVLTLGSNVTIDESGYAQIADSGYAGDGIVNQGAIKQSGTGSQLTFYGASLTNSGTITAASSGGALTIDDTTFTNSGALAVSNGETATIDPTSFTNAAAGVISVGADSALSLTLGGSWSNLGSITLASGSSLYLRGSFTIASLGSITNSGGTVYIQGTLTNTGTLNGTNVLGPAVLDGGTVQGGTAKPAGLVLSDGGGTLSGVTYDGTLNLSGSGDSISLASGTVVNNAAGTGAGTINDTGENSALYFDNTQTFNNATINLGSAVGGHSVLYEYNSTRAGTVLTLGSNITINESGSAIIEDSGNAGDGVVNQGNINQSGTSSSLNFNGNSLTNSGTITGASSDGALTIDDATFTNSGTLAVSNGDTVTIEPTTFTNLSGTTLTGGAFSVGAGSVMELANNAKIAIDDATIALSGAGSAIQSYNTTTKAQQLFDTTLRTVGASGQLYLLADRSLTTAAAAITDNGLIQLGGGTLTVTGSGSSLTIGAAGELAGFGIVDATTLTNSGEIVASGGTLTVQNAVAGTGGVEIDANATLVLDASTASGAPATFEGADATLTLGNPASFAGTVGGVVAGDVIDLVGIAANGASVNSSNQLVVTDNGTTVDTVQLSGDNSAFAFATQAVSGGTDVTAQPASSPPIPATVADYEAYTSAYNQMSGGFPILDTAANISAALNLLNGSNANSITISDNNPVGVDVAELTSDATAISLLANQSGSPYQLAVTDTAANISAGLDGLNGSNIASITISDNNPVAVDIAQLTNDATAISKLANAGGGAYQLAISGTAANVQGDLANLEADVAHIASITLTSGTVAVSVSTFTADQGAVDKIIGGFAISDTAANISASLNALNDANIDTITITDNNPVGVDVAQLTSDATAIGKLANANGAPYQLAISGAAANVQADLANLQADVAHIASITLTSGTVAVSISTFTADQGALDKIIGGFAISDTAANISASLNALNDANIGTITITDNNPVGVDVVQLTSDSTAISKLADANGDAYQLAVTDTAANISAGLNGLNGSDIASITISDNNPVAVDIAQLTNDATAISKLANANNSAYQLAISGTAANVQGDLANLEADVAHIASITLTSGTVVVSVSTFTADQGALNKIVDGFAISDTAANISASLNALNDADIDTITITDNNPVGVDVAQLTSDSTAIGKLANANGAPYQLAITDSLPDIVNDLSALNSDSHVVSLDATSGKATLSGGVGVNAPALALTGSAIVLTVAETISYSGALSENAGSTISISSGDELSLTGTTTLSGTTSGAGTLNLTGGSATIESGAKVTVSNWSISGSGIDVTLDEALTYSGSFSEGAGSTISISSADELSLTGTVSLSGTTSGAGTLDLAGKSSTVESGATLSVSNWSISGSGTDVTLGEALTYSGSFSEGAGSTISISSADELSLAGATTLSGTTSGAGTLDLAGGSATIKSGAKVAVSNWSISGSGADVTLDEALTYSGSFSEGAGDTFVLSGGNLLLTGADTFAGGTVDGAKLLETEGTTTVSGLTIGGTVEWENTNTVAQTGGTVTIGDSSGDKASLDNTATGVYDITGASAIGRGSSTVSDIKNAGLFEQTGTGTSTIEPAVTNTGTIEVTSGTLDFMGAVTGKGIETISGASTLEFDAAVASKATVGNQNIGFTGGGTLDLTDPTVFWGEISGFATTDTIELLGSWAFSSFSENSGGTLATLRLISGATKHAFDFVGDYTRADFQITSGATSTITYA